MEEEIIEEEKKSIVLAILEPLIYINMFIMACSAAWVALSPYFLLVGIAIILIAFYSFLIPISLIPAGILSNFMIFFQKTGKVKVENAFLVASMGYVILFLSFWCVYILNISLGRVGEGYEIPAVLFANAAAFTCLYLWVSGDKKNFFMIRLIEFAQLVMILLSVVKLIIIKIPFWHQMGFFFASMVLVVLLQYLYDELAKN